LRTSSTYPSSVLGFGQSLMSDSPLLQQISLHATVFHLDTRIIILRRASEGRFNPIVDRRTR
jgi:hypothetical protein